MRGARVTAVNKAGEGPARNILTLVLKCTEWEALTSGRPPCSLTIWETERKS